MTKKQAKKLLPAITHFANGGKLWWFQIHAKIWKMQDVLFVTDDELCNIIKDKHFEARKAHSLGQPIEYCAADGKWFFDPTPTWNDGYSYRPKPKETFPSWRKHKISGHIIKFITPVKWEMIYSAKGSVKVGYIFNDPSGHSYKSSIWEECDEPVYEWQYNSYDKIAKEWTMSKFYYNSDDIEGEWVRFEPSKRLRR